MEPVKIVSSDFLFLDYKDWFVQPHDRRANLGRRVGSLSISISRPSSSFIYTDMGKEQVNKTFLYLMDVYENMKLIYFKFEKNLDSGIEFMVEIYNELKHTHNINFVFYSKTSNLNVDGLFIPTGFLLRNNGRFLSMGNQTYERFIKHLEKKNEITNST